MKNEDDILRDLMTNRGDNYIRDEGFTHRVLGALPEKKNGTAQARRWLLVTGSALVGCVIAGALSGPTILQLAERFCAIPMKIADGTDFITLGSCLASALFVAAALGLACVKWAKR